MNRMTTERISLTTDDGKERRAGVEEYIA